ncbi:RluA family pseudouridine synthase [Mycoplasma sp. NEAQ87857]|uniref:RluA family pseudouridine synthase n=1 Tax=Mycoplasma sp. NEAQ87857 TaxID=2683967 RepID=UPI001317EDDE|nr:RluA family pseudouridine synthase [Mycoplasma sp. NEAQ87857]QGZ97302.1 RluA family pseudouridine synthase [Mycoplasma sp. NEAQ87857]
MFEIQATLNDHNRTIFKVLTKYLNNLPLSKIESLFRKKDIKVNGKRNIKKDYIVQENDHIVVYGIVDFKKKETIAKINYDFKILYEDDNLLIIDKKSGIAVHDGENNLDLQVLNYLKFKPVDSFKPSHIGRLDKDTSGIIVYGKNYQTVSQFNAKSNSFIKKYQFISDFNQDKLEVRLYHKKDHLTGKIKVYAKEVPDSKLAITILETLGKKKLATIKTGRKHQIRLALKWLNQPIYGDRKYGGKKASRLMLHSYYLKLNNLEGDLEYLNGMEFYSIPKW